MAKFLSLPDDAHAEDDCIMSLFIPQSQGNLDNHHKHLVQICKC